MPPPQEHHNGFDLLRLILALLVVYTHSYLLGGFGEEPTFRFFKGQLIFGSMAVLGFFGISGYLVTGSFERSATLWSFFTKRALRIFPGFWVCLLVIALVIAPLLYLGRGRSLADYPWFGPDGALRYIAANSLLHVGQWNIGQALEGAPYEGSLNGSLWSIFPEFCCYLLTMLVGLLGVHHKNKNLFVGLLGYLSVVHVLKATHVGEITPALGPTFLTLTDYTQYYLAYLVGAGLWLFRDHFRPNASGCVFAGLLVLLSMKYGGLVLLAPFAFPVFLIYLAHLFAYPLKWDLSYGVYLYHFPIFQVLALFDWPGRNPLVFQGLGLVATIVLAAASWVWVERPALQLKPRRREVARVKPGSEENGDVPAATAPVSARAE